MMTYVVSADGLAFIKALEGFHAEPKQMPDGNWLVGYGHVRVGQPGGEVSEADAHELLRLDVAPFERMLSSAATMPLTQAQFDSLASFAFSIGAEAFLQSQVLRRVNAGDYVAAACAMDAWRKSDVGGETEILDVLVRRRAAEKALFLGAVEPAPSAFLRAQIDHAAAILGAPVKYAAAPEVGVVAVVAAKAPAAEIITGVLKAEPATEALLLTQALPPEETAQTQELATAHAKPVARSLQQARQAMKRAADEALVAQAQRGRSFSRMVESVIGFFRAPARA